MMIKSRKMVRGENKKWEGEQEVIKEGDRGRKEGESVMQEDEGGKLNNDDDKGENKREGNKRRIEEEVIEEDR